MTVSILLFLASSATAQEQSGRLIGRVLDSGGLPVPGVLVEASGPNLPVARQTSTDARGMFRFVGLPVGTYRIDLTRIGLRAVSHADVMIQLGRTTSLGDTEMAVKAVEMEPLVIEGRAFIVDPTTTTLGSNIASSLFEQLPIDRDYKGVLQLLPQANASFLGDPINVAGSTGLENAYVVDGVNVTDAFRARTGTDLPYNFVEAIELKRGGYEAEFGQALGGLVNVTTRSGTNEFRAEAFGYASGSGVAADARAIPGRLDVTSFSDYDVGVSLSGPIVRDRAWFFAAYNPSFVRQDIELPGLGIHDGAVTKHMFATKLTWRPTGGTDLRLSVFGDPTTFDEVDLPPPTLLNADPVLASHREGGVNVSLTAQSRVGRHLVLDALVARHQRSEERHGTTERGRTEPRFIDLSDPTDEVWSGGYYTEEAFGSRRTTARVTGSVFVGRHTLKAGLQYREDVVDAFQDIETIWKRAEDDYRPFLELQDVTVRNRLPSAFVQDSWQIAERLRLNAGLRWDGQYLIGEDGDVVLRITDQWQPRLGFVFEPGRPGTQKIYGSVSRFYQPMALLFSSAFQAGYGAWESFYSVDPRDFPDSADSVRVSLDPDAPLFPELEGVEGEHLDEFAIGYERLVTEGLKLGIRGVHRALRANIQLMFDADGIPVAGNRGEGELSDYPKPTRTYTALELTAQHSGERLSALASYVLSRSHGDYAGLFAYESGGLEEGSFGPNVNQTLWYPAQAVNNKGLLPNDRTHVFKVSGAYRFDFGLTASTFFSWSSGTPLNEFGWAPGGFFTPIFLVERGTAGRTPSIRDLNLRFAYELPERMFGGRVVLDLLHLGNPREIVRVDEFRTLDAEGSLADGSHLASFGEMVDSQIGENPTFGQPTAFQPPFTVRLGFELGITP